MLNNKKKFVSTLIVIGLLFSEICFAGGVGTTGAQFLKIAPGARPSGMGGAFSAVADDLNAIYWNPAGLALQKDRQASASYIKYFQGVNIGFLGYSQEAFGYGTLGVGFNYLTVGDIERRATDVDTSVETFGANDMAVYLSYGSTSLLGRFVENLNFGMSLKYIKQTIDTENASSYAFDAGTLYKTPIKHLSASLGVYNVGSKVKFVEESDSLPMDVRLGAAYKFFQETFLVAADLDDYINDERIYSQLGMEYTFNKAVSIRAGYKFGMDSNKLGGAAGIGTGFGVNVWGVQLDYAYVPFGELTDTHRVSMSAKF